MNIGMPHCNVRHLKASLTIRYVDSSCASTKNVSDRFLYRTDAALLRSWKPESSDIGQVFVTLS